MPSKRADASERTVFSFSTVTSGLRLRLVPLRLCIGLGRPLLCLLRIGIDGAGERKPHGKSRSLAGLLMDPDSSVVRLHELRDDT